MNMFKKTSLAVAICLMPTSVYSQVDLVQCHRGCMIQGITANFDEYTEYQSFNVLQVCQNDQELVFSLKACANSCRDIAEIKYGDRKAGTDLASYKYLSSMIYRVTTPLKASGLWKGRDTPTLADEDISTWAMACGKYINQLEAIDYRIRCERYPENENYCSFLDED